MKAKRFSPLTEFLANQLLKITEKGINGKGGRPVFSFMRAGGYDGVYGKIFLDMEKARTVDF
jgi:hypothetical protein